MSSEKKPLMRTLRTSRPGTTQSYVPPGSLAACAPSRGLHEISEVDTGLQPQLPFLR